MKTTLELPEDLMREVRVRAAREDKKLKDLVAELLRRGLADDDARPGHRVQLPLIVGSPPSDPTAEITPERAAELLLEDEAAATS